MIKHVEPFPFYKEAMYYTGLISIITSILGIAFISNKLYPYFQIPLIIAGSLFGIITYFMWDTRCPKCKRTFVKNETNKEKIDEQIIPKTHYDRKKYLYSDGSVKNVENGKAHVIDHKIHTHKHHYLCKRCNNKWSNDKKIDLDKNTFQPKVTIIKTEEKNPLENFLDNGDKMNNDSFGTSTNNTNNKKSSNHTRVKPLTKYEAEKVIMQRGNKCEYPHCNENVSLEVHHITKRSNGGSNKYSNLVVLCPTHHRKADRGSINATRLKMIVSHHIKNKRKSINS
ncbi:MAG: HNH endonuclease [Nanoarchaeota archaeon]|nr:HNH endonuclease [Nanoarchaeota archaeon]